LTFLPSSLLDLSSFIPPWPSFLPSSLTSLPSLLPLFLSNWNLLRSYTISIPCTVNFFLTSARPDVTISIPCTVVRSYTSASTRFQFDSSIFPSLAHVTSRHSPSLHYTILNLLCNVYYLFPTEILNNNNYPL
jgi:hypothetical protein